MASIPLVKSVITVLLMVRETIPLSYEKENEKMGSKVVEGIGLFVSRSSCHVHDSINNLFNELCGKNHSVCMFRLVTSGASFRAIGTSCIIWKPLICRVYRSVRVIFLQLVKLHPCRYYLRT